MLQLSNCGLEQVRLRVTTFSGFLGGHSTGRLSQFLGFSQRGFFPTRVRLRVTHLTHSRLKNK